MSRFKNESVRLGSVIDSTQAAEEHARHAEQNLVRPDARQEAERAAEVPIEEGAADLSRVHLELGNRATTRSSEKKSISGLGPLEPRKAFIASMRVSVSTWPWRMASAIIAC